MKYDLTIGIPTYNRAHCLGRAIDSVLAIDDVDIEVVVSDNCSSDETPLVMQKYRDNSRVKYLRNSFNVGPTGNYNKCLENASGQYFMILGDDDWLSPNYGRVLIDTVNNEDVVFVGRCITVSPAGLEINKSSDSCFDVKGPNFIKDFVENRSYTGRHAYFMLAAKTDSIKGVGGFPPTQSGQHSDNLLLLRLLLSRPIRNNPSAINYYSVYPESYGNSDIKSISVATLQLVNYWDDYIHSELSKILSKREVASLRENLKRNATLTYIHRVLIYGVSFREKLTLLLIFPRKSWLIKAFIRNITVLSIIRKISNTSIRKFNNV